MPYKNDPRKRVPIDIRPFWEDLKKFWGNNLSNPSLIKSAIAVGIEFREAIAELGLTAPLKGDIKRWLRELRARPIHNRSELFWGWELAELETETKITVADLTAIARGIRQPTPQEAVILGSVLRVGSKRVMEICKVNGGKSNGVER